MGAHLSRKLEIENPYVALASEDSVCLPVVLEEAALIEGNPKTFF